MTDTVTFDWADGWAMLTLNMPGTHTGRMNA